MKVGELKADRADSKNDRPVVEFECRNAPERMAREMLAGRAFFGRELGQLVGCADLREQPEDAARARAGM